jgi:hypothetical protein
LTNGRDTPMRTLQTTELTQVTGAKMEGPGSVMAYSMVGTVVGIGAAVAAMPAVGLFPPMGMMAMGAIGGAVSISYFGDFATQGALTGAVAGLAAAAFGGGTIEGAMAMSVLSGIVGINACAAYSG